MTVICVAVDRTHVAMAADRLVTDSEGYRHDLCKVTPLRDRRGQEIGAVGTAGSFLAGEQVERALGERVLAAKSIKDPRELIRSAILDLSSEGDDETPGAHGAVILCGRAYVIDGAGTVIETTQWAAGSGGHIALGALWKRRGTARSKVIHAVSAACDLIVTCGGGLDWFEMERAHDV